MNVHAQVKVPVALLSAFWRNGRQVFVPLTNAELDAAGMGPETRAMFQRLNLISLQVLQRAGRIGVWEITAAGVNALDTGEIKAPEKKSDGRASAGKVRTRRAQFELLAALDKGPVSNGELAAAVGRDVCTTSKGVTRLVAHGLATRAAGKPGGKVGGNWSVITITPAGREWLAQNGGGELAAQEARS